MGEIKDTLLPDFPPQNEVKELTVASLWMRWVCFGLMSGQLHRHYGGKRSQGPPVQMSWVMKRHLQR